MDVSFLQINDVKYNIKDRTARSAASYADETVTFEQIGG